jgi:hypothetical protein
MESDVSVGEDLPLREYIGFIWIDDKPGIRLRILAASGMEAESRVIEEYGEGHVFSIWNEEDAARPR